MELGPEDVSLLERCPHFKGCYVRASKESGSENVSLLERCPQFRGFYAYIHTCICLRWLHTATWTHMVDLSLQT